MRRIIAVLLENEAGALSRVVGLFAQRNYNIESLTVAATEDHTLSRLTLTTFGDASHTEQIIKQLHKLVEVVKVMDLCEAEHVERELMLAQLMEFLGPRIDHIAENLAKYFRLGEVAALRTSA